MKKYVEFVLALFFIFFSSSAALTTTADADTVALFKALDDLPFQTLCDERRLSALVDYVGSLPPENQRRAKYQVQAYLVSNNLGSLFVAFLQQSGWDIPFASTPHLPVHQYGHVYSNCTLPQLALLQGRFELLRFLLGLNFNFEWGASDETGSKLDLIDLSKKVEGLPRDLVALIKKTQLNYVLQQFNPLHRRPAPVVLPEPAAAVVEWPELEGLPIFPINTTELEESLSFNPNVTLGTSPTL